MYIRFFKRVIDIIFSLIILSLLSPLILLTTLVLFIDYKGTPFFFQNRVGLNNKVFLLIKFKTMSNARDKDGNLLPDNVRITKFGAIIRKLSLDELLQLINVISGDMSLVGPRPLLVQYLPLYNSTQIQRHNVKPGITGWAQVNGRNNITWKSKFEHDLWYVENLSLAVDLKIMWLTLLKVIRREGVNQSDNTTMEYFNGYN